jgi:putative methyltransferase
VWGCHSIVDRQAVGALARLLAADVTHCKGTTLKSLTLAPHVQAKKATYAVTIKTLEHLVEIKDVVQRTGLLKAPRLQPEAAYVLVYELLFGEGLKPYGPAERAVLAASDALRAALAAMHDTSQPEPSITAPAAPRAARVNTLKMTVTEALSWLRRPPKSAGVASHTVRTFGHE